MSDVALKCACGKLRGVATEVSATTGNRMVCYCDDCQAYARWLGRDDLVDAHGGTDVYQLAPGRMRITDGRDQLACVRLGPKGLFRFYAACCRTPVGNTLPNFPFVGIPRAFMDVRDRDAVLGPSRGNAYTKFAVAGAHLRDASTARAIARILRLMLGWIVRGKARPSPFFDAAKRPIVEPKVLTEEERAKAYRAA